MAKNRKTEYTTSDTQLDILIESYEAIGEERMSIHQWQVYNCLVELRIIRELTHASSNT